MYLVGGFDNKEEEARKKLFLCERVYGMCCRYFLLANGEISAVLCEVLVVFGTYNMRGIISNRCVNISFK